MCDTLIQPGDKVFMAFPVDLNRAPEDIAEALDDTYPGVDFEVTVSDHIAYPQIIFVYRDGVSFREWHDERKREEAEEQGVGLVPARQRYMGVYGSSPVNR